MVRRIRGHSTVRRRDIKATAARKAYMAAGGKEFKEPIVLINFDFDRKD